MDKSELDAYMEDEHVRDDEKFEILSWWKINKDKYPILSYQPWHETSLQFH